MSFSVENHDTIRFGADGLVPVVVQERRTGEVLMVAYANREAVALTLSEGYAHFYSRSRQELWKKGATSGSIQKVTEVRIDCDGDALLYRVEAQGPACHTGARSCFYREVGDAQAPKESNAATQTGAGHGPEPETGEGVSPEILSELFDVIVSRKDHLPEGSYVASLFSGNWDAALRKIGEEATEVMLAAVEPEQPGLVAEVADLWFHSLVVLAQHDRTLEQLLQELKRRRH